MISFPSFAKARSLFSFGPSQAEKDAIQREQEELNRRAQDATRYRLWMNETTTKEFMSKVTWLLIEQQENLISCKPEQLSLLQEKIKVLQSVLDIPQEAMRGHPDYQRRAV
jgi:hypothetical protein